MYLPSPNSYGKSEANEITFSLMGFGLDRQDEFDLVTVVDVRILGFQVSSPSPSDYVGDNHGRIGHPLP